jgi:hypothetical protein
MKEGAGSGMILKPAFLCDEERVPLINLLTPKFEGI